MAAQCPQLLAKSPSALRSKCDYVAGKTSTPVAQVVALARLQPGLLLKSPTVLTGNLVGVSRLLAVPVAQAARVLLAQPELAGMSFQAVGSNTDRVVSELRDIAASS